MPKISIEKKIRSLNAKVNKLKEEIHKESQKAFKQMVKDIFKKYQNLQSFAWHQYTPYFNDGDTCTFSAYIDYIYLNGSDESECLYDVQEFMNQVKDKKKSIAKLEKEIKSGDKWLVERNRQRIEEINNTNIEEVTIKYNTMKDIFNCLSLVGEDVLQSMFGDHVSVIVSRDGITTEEYEHE